MSPEDILKKISDEMRTPNSNLHVQVEVITRVVNLMNAMFNTDDIEVLKHNGKVVCVMYSQLVSMYREAGSLKDDLEVTQACVKYFEHRGLDLVRMALDLK